MTLPEPDTTPERQRRIESLEFAMSLNLASLTGTGSQPDIKVVLKQADWFYQYILNGRWDHADE